MKQLESKGLYRIPTPTPFPVGAANVYLYKGDALTLFDAGTKTDDAWGVLTCRLRELGVALRDIEQIILTHHHLDHLGLSRRIKDASNAIVYAHPEAAAQIPYMYDESESRLYLEPTLRELGVPATVVEEIIALRHLNSNLLDDFVIDKTVAEDTPVGPFEAHFRPGHSITDTLYVHHTERWALTGDHLIRNVTPNPLLRRRLENGVREHTLVQYCDALKKTRELELSWCLPGHGAPFQDHRSVADATFRHIERRGEKVLQAVPQTGATPYDVTCALFPRLKGPERYYCLCAATGHLELLESQGRLHSARRDGVLHYIPQEHTTISR
ncbi:MAG TPA: MBL fold metallo-hydrolase [Candidatus Hydrogenedentes bacterium]|nr:MBL fold metallo-hydrolase [Candidatus Hydrogenedentota bacterium]